jgi:hypothetical protein
MCLSLCVCLYVYICICVHTMAKACIHMYLCRTLEKELLCTQWPKLAAERIFSALPQSDASSSDAAADAVDEFAREISSGDSIVYRVRRGVCKESAV